MRLPITTLFLYFLLVGSPLFCQTFTVEMVPNTKLTTNSYISDPTHLLSDTTTSRLNSLLHDFEEKATVQIAIVMLPSIGEEDPVDFAQRLFVHWGIGRSGKDNGLLVLFILDQHTIRFHTGYGLEGVLPDVTCKRIQQKFMVPYFKNGEYDRGMLEGVTQVVQLLSNPESIAEIFEEDKPAEDYYLYITLMIVYAVAFLILYFVAAGLEKFKSTANVPSITLSKKRWLLLYGLIPFSLLLIAFNAEWSFSIFFPVLFALILLLFTEKYFRIRTIAAPYLKAGDFQTLYTFYKRQNAFWIGSAIFFPLPMLLVFYAFRKTRDGMRNHARKCKTCGTIIAVKLTEQTEDEFLKSGQIAEEKAGTIDYDVWKCSSCNTVDIIQYPSPKSNYTRCPKCNFMTYHFGNRRTIQAATYQSEGRGEEERTCLHCGHHHIDTYIIPIIVHSTSSDSDSSSSSSDSGGSWGGGDSGGGGASSTW